MDELTLPISISRLCKSPLSPKAQGGSSQWWAESFANLPADPSEAWTQAEQGSNVSKLLQK
jgi:hypothetical protein